jgi:hypothetical protein
MTPVNSAGLSAVTSTPTQYGSLVVFATGRAETHRDCGPGRLRLTGSQGAKIKP